MATIEINHQVASNSSRHILAEIVQHKQQEIAQMQADLPLAELQKQVNDTPWAEDFLMAIEQSHHKPSLIAEVKKASPSKGIICADFEPVKIAKAYEQSGATCISVLTDRKFFQGSFDNLRRIRQSVAIPLLCKEFVIDPYQIYLARASGADAVLLIAAVLSDGNLQEFLQVAHGLGMTALVEVHTLDELDRVLALSDVRLVGINNRNLDNFHVDLATTQQLMAQRRQQINELGITVVSESGLHAPDDLSLVAASGVRAVLVGESLVKQSNLEQAVRKLLKVSSEQ